MGWRDDPLVEEEEPKRRKASWRTDEIVNPTATDVAKDIGVQLPTKLARGALEIPLALPRLGNLAAGYFAPESDFAAKSQAWIDKADETLANMGLDQHAQTTPGRYVGAVAEALPGFAAPGVGFGGQIARGVATSIPGQVSRFKPIAQTLGGSLGAGVAGQAAEDLGADPLTRGLASIAGGVGGALGAPRSAATAADLWFSQRGAVPLGPRGIIPEVTGYTPETGNNPFVRAQRAPGSAGGPPQPIAGMPGGPAGPLSPAHGGGLGPNDPAAYDVLHRALVQAGVPPERIPEALQAYLYARTARPNSIAAGEISLMDLDPALQSVAASISRMSPEGANIIRPVIRAKQTGAPSRELDPSMGVRTRPSGARIEDAGPEMRGPGGKPLPVGQHENIGEILRRHLEIEDMDYHGHGTTARETGAMIAEKQSAQAAGLWDATRAAAEGIDVGADPGVQAAVKKWVDARNNKFTPDAKRKLIDRVLANMAPGKGGRVSPLLDDFHEGKMIVDKMISPYYTGIGGKKNARLGAMLVEMKNDIQGAVGRIKQNDLGAKYRKANSEFAGHETALREMELGERVWSGTGKNRMRAEEALAPYHAAEAKANSELGKLRMTKENRRTPEQIDAIAEWEDKRVEARASIKRIKHGFYSAAMEESGPAQLASDRTRMFHTPNRKDDLSHMIERTGGDTAAGEFWDRPQRFYDALEFEEKKIASRNVIQGGSPTQERAIRDQMFDTLHTIRDVLTGGPTAMLTKGAELLFERFFGMSADVNVALARKLASTKTSIHEEAYRELAMRVGRSRADIFRQVMEAQRRAISASTAAGVTGAQEGQ